MNDVIQFPKGYRYNSDIELFKSAVDCTKEILESGKAVIIYQFIDVVSAKVFMSQDEFEQKYDKIGWNDFNDILDNEIVYLLGYNFEGSMDSDPGLKRYLEEEKVSEELQEKIIELKLDKCKYVDQNLGGEKENVII